MFLLAWTQTFIHFHHGSFSWKLLLHKGCFSDSWSTQAATVSRWEMNLTWKVINLQIFPESFSLWRGLSVHTWSSWIWVWLSLWIWLMPHITFCNPSPCNLVGRAHSNITGNTGVSTSSLHKLQICQRIPLDRQKIQSWRANRNIYTVKYCVILL